MSIASAIATKQQQVADSYTAVSNKGGTLPATQNLTNLATAISSIPSGSSPTLITKSITQNGTYNASSDNADGYSSVTVNVSGGGGGSKFGATIDTLLGDVDANGVLQQPTEQSDLVFTGVKNLSNYALYYKFCRTKAKSVLFPDLEEANGTNCLSRSFDSSDIKTASFPKLISIDGATYVFSSSHLESVSMPNLTTVIGGGLMNGLLRAFEHTQITELNFPKLTTILGNGYALSYICNSCPKLETVRFPMLATIPTKSSSSYSNFSTAFSSCQALKDIYFNAVNSNTFTGGYTYVFNSMFNNSSGRTNGCTVHFPSNMQSIISGLNGYPTFGGNASYITIAFDLPATS